MTTEIVRTNFPATHITIWFVSEDHHTFYIWSDLTLILSTCTKDQRVLFTKNIYHNQVTDLILDAGYTITDAGDYVDRDYKD